MFRLDRSFILFAEAEENYHKGQFEDAEHSITGLAYDAATVLNAATSNNPYSSTVSYEDARDFAHEVFLAEKAKEIVKGNTYLNSKKCDIESEAKADESVNHTYRFTYYCTYGEGGNGSCN